MCEISKGICGQVALLLVILSINAKKFQNFFILFAKKYKFFSIINMYKKNLFLGEKL